MSNTSKKITPLIMSHQHLMALFYLVFSTAKCIEFLHLIDTFKVQHSNKLRWS